MKVALLSLLASLTTGSWSVSPATEVRRIIDTEAGVICYVVGDGAFTFTAHGISCVKVK